MRIIDALFIPAPREKVWRVITDYEQLARWAGLTNNFTIDDVPVTLGAHFSEVHLFLGRRTYTGIFTGWILGSMWVLQSHPGPGTGIPVYHDVRYTIFDHADGTALVSTAEYATRWPLGKLIDLMLYPFAYMYVWHLHRKIRQGCLK